MSMVARKESETVMFCLDLVEPSPSGTNSCMVELDWKDGLKPLLLDRIRQLHSEVLFGQRQPVRDWLTISDEIEFQTRLLDMVCLKPVLAADVGYKPAVTNIRHLHPEVRLAASFEWAVVNVSDFCSVFMFLDRSDMVADVLKERAVVLPLRDGSSAEIYDDTAGVEYHPGVWPWPLVILDYSGYRPWGIRPGALAPDCPIPPQRRW